MKHLIFNRARIEAIKSTPNSLFPKTPTHLRQVSELYDSVHKPLWRIGKYFKTFPAVFIALIPSSPH